MVTSHTLLMPSLLETATVTAAKAHTRRLAAQSKLSKPPEVYTLHTEQSSDNYFAGQIIFNNKLLEEQPCMSL